MRRFFRRKATKKTKLRNSVAPSSAYKEALNHYQQAVAPATSNDDGRTSEPLPRPIPSPSSPSAQTARRRYTSVTTTGDSDAPDSEDSSPDRGADAPLIGQARNHHQGGPIQEFPIDEPMLSDASFSSLNRDNIMTPNRHNLSQQHESAAHQGFRDGSSVPWRSGIKRVQSDVASVFVDSSYPPQPQRVDPQMPDTTYEEHYGDAYIGAPIKYVYPSGYQSMRPRGGPWRLSIAVCLLFTWLSVFTVGYCSEQFSGQAAANEVGDDDYMVIETRWCGSRLLYFMWVMSMLITGLATAYCSVIGYIKARDFCVANVRSQPPGVPSSNSDFYVKIDDGPYQPPAQTAGDQRYYQQTIYQADGTPQFWGGHIYRPTQAAVAVTSR